MNAKSLGMALLRPLEPLRQRFEARNPRERLLIILVGAVLIWGLAQIVYFNHAAMREKALRAAIGSAQGQLAQLQVREQQLRAQLAEGALTSLQREKENLLRRQGELDAALQQRGLELIDAERMRQVLHELLQGSSLRLVALRRLPPERLLGTAPPAEAETAGQEAKAPPAAPQQEITLYRHRVQIELEGRYADMLAYLQRLEASPWRLMWQDLDIQTVAYPTARLRLTVYTLSLQEEWLRV